MRTYLHSKRHYGRVLRETPHTYRRKTSVHVATIAAASTAAKATATLAAWPCNVPTKLAVLFVYTSYRWQ